MDCDGEVEGAGYWNVWVGGIICLLVSGRAEGRVGAGAALETIIECARSLWGLLEMT